MKASKERLDLLVFERGLADSRVKAQALILAGQVVVNEQRVDKPGTRVPTEADIRLKGEVIPYVSRGGLKLRAALDVFPEVALGKICADIGASTGGFTDCLLQSGATKVYAIDVGHGQLHEKLRQDARVISKEGVNARYLTPNELPEPVEVMVMDVSFISLNLVLPKAEPFLLSGGWLFALMKPQFEAGPDKVEKGGVVRDENVRQEVFRGLSASVEALGFSVRAVVESPISGPAGNREAILCAQKN